MSYKKQIANQIFKIKIEDSAKGDYIVEEFNVPVVRVNDDPPKVTELFIYDLYKEDLIVNKITNFYHLLSLLVQS